MPRLGHSERNGRHVKRLVDALLVQERNASRHCSRRKRPPTWPCSPDDWNRRHACCAGMDSQASQCSRSARWQPHHDALRRGPSRLNECLPGCTFWIAFNWMRTGGGFPRYARVRRRSLSVTFRHGVQHRFCCRSFGQHGDEQDVWLYRSRIWRHSISEDDARSCIGIGDFISRGHQENQFTTTCATMMNSLAKQWLDNTRSVMDRIEQTQAENIRQAAEAMADSIAAGRWVHTF